MAVTHEELVDRARQLAPAIAQRALATERHGAMLDETYAELLAANFFPIMVPQRFGGHELGPRTLSAVVNILGSACVSTAWVAGFYIGHNWMHTQFPEESQEEVYAGQPFSISPGTFSPSYRLTPVDGGYLVSGRAAWGSGAAHAQRIMGAGIVAGDGAQRGPLSFYVSKSEATILPNWEVVGMRGTGSDDIVLDEVFIPQHHTLSAMAMLRGQTPGSLIHDNPLYRMPMFPVVLCEGLPAIVGALRGAAEAFLALTKDRITTHGRAAVADKQAAQMRIGRGHVNAELAEQMLWHYVDSVTGGDAVARFDQHERVALKARNAALTSFCRDSIADLMHGAGANAFRDQGRLQRFHRDITMLSTHAFNDMDGATEGYGRSLLGLDAGAPI